MLTARAAASPPDDVVAAATWLFDHGLADPRGCEYREVELEMGEPWSGALASVTTHAWVEPDGARAAIAWNGVVYGVARVGERADLAADVRAAVAARDLDTGYYSLLVDFKAIRPLWAPLLLRLGEDELAGAAWSALHPNEEEWTVQILAADIAAMTQARVESKDPKALSDYGDWVTGVTPEGLDDYITDALQPLWQYPTDPAIDAAARKLLAAPAWTTLPLRLFEQPILASPAMRDRLLVELADRSVVGTVEVTATRVVNIQLDGGSGTGYGNVPDATPMPPRPLARNELLAFRLSIREPPVPFAFDWPAERREQAIAAWADRLRASAPGAPSR